MPRKSLIVSGMPNKEVNPPAIIDPTTPTGKALVHKKAEIQSAHEISGGVRKIVEKSDGAYVEDGLDQEKDVKDVSKKVIDGQVEQNPAREEGTHTLNGNHIIGDGDRVEDNPSKETATKSVSDEIISGEVEDNPSREESVQSVTNQVISGDVEPSPDKQQGTHSVTDQIVEGRVEDNPTREEALETVQGKKVNGEIASSATTEFAFPQITIGDDLLAPGVNSIKVLCSRGGSNGVHTIENKTTNNTLWSWDDGTGSYTFQVGSLNNPLATIDISGVTAGDYLTGSRLVIAPDVEYPSDYFLGGGHGRMSNGDVVNVATNVTLYSFLIVGADGNIFFEYKDPGGNWYEFFNGYGDREWHIPGGAPTTADGIKIRAEDDFEDYYVAFIAK